MGKNVYTEIKCHSLLPLDDIVTMVCHKVSKAQGDLDLDLDLNLNLVLNLDLNLDLDLNLNLDLDLNLVIGLYFNSWAHKVLYLN